MAEAKVLNCYDLKLKGTRVVWEIKDFQSQSHIHKDFLRSPSFYLDNETWEIRLYHKGNLKQGFISLCVENMTKKEKKPLLVVHATLLNANGFGMVECIDVKSTLFTGLWEFPDFIREIKLLGYLFASINKTFKVVCFICDLQSPANEETIAIQTETISDGSRVLIEDMENLYVSNELCDVKIKVGPKDFLAHRAILAARSPVFLSMFKHEMIEKVDGVIEISDCDPDSFENFLKFLYTGKVSNTETDNPCLYKIADKYCVNNLKNVCADRMSKKLEVETVCDVLELATVHNETELLELATMFFIKNAKYVFATEKWNTFMIENTSLASEILKKMAEKTQLKADE